MDGPNVNWKFFTDMKKKLSDDFDTILINIGSCGLHIVHNSFKTGATATEWKVEALLSSLYYLFKDSPARREDFSKVSGSTRLPLKFVNHRWLENETPQFVGFDGNRPRIIISGHTFSRIFHFKKSPCF